MRAVMHPIRTRLHDVARKAKARMPSVARGLIDRLETAYRTRREPAASATPPAHDDAPPVAPAEPARPKAINWELRSQAELVDHIEQHYHAGLRSQLPRLVQRARVIERENAQHADAPTGLADLLEQFASNLESHMAKEERMLFPILRTGSRGGPVDMPIRMMEREHDSHDSELEQIRQLTHDLVAPSDASADWQRLYADLATLEAELHQHIYLENNVLFARALGGEY